MVGGELGGPPVSRYLSCTFLFILWFIYLIFSTLQAYSIINVKIGYDGTEPQFQK